MSRKEGVLLKFTIIAQWFGPFGEQAMWESSFLIDKLIERFCIFSMLNHMIF
jgi:chorismate mutase / prephenate dehydrogenase